MATVMASDPVLPWGAMVLQQQGPSVRTGGGLAMIPEAIASESPRSIRGWVCWSMPLVIAIVGGRMAMITSATGPPLC